MNAAPLHPGEALARATLRRCGLSAGQPLKDLLGVIEAKVHVPVLIDRFNDGEIAGVLLRQADGESFIAINADHLPVRQRFTLAHEWGHIEAGHTPRVELSANLFGRPKDLQEIEANYFAAEILAPRDALVPWLTEHELIGNMDAAAVAQMAMHFGIAFPAACYRLERAGVIDEARKEALVATLKVEGRSYAQRFEKRRHRDALEEIAAKKGAYPRIPEIMKAYASEALKFDLIDRGEYDEMMGTRDRLDVWLA